MSYTANVEFRKAGSTVLCAQSEAAPEGTPGDECWVGKGVRGEKKHRTEKPKASIGVHREWRGLFLIHRVHKLVLAIFDLVSL